MKLKKMVNVDSFSTEFLFCRLWCKCPEKIRKGYHHMVDSFAIGLQIRRFTLWIQAVA